ncbi:MAG: hypothetical protein JW821_08490 [Deltaproteobacteria bacterium]|nr:hypothetical protein [Deltaproteobacteria bacterium]
MIRKYGVVVALMVGLILSFPPDLPAEEETREIQALGMADGRSAGARDEALNDALRRAVEQGVGTFVTAELTVEQQRLVDEKVFTESSGYVQRYDVLREGEQDGVYEVEIRAMVRMGKLAGDLQAIGLLLRKKQNPRCMVVAFSREVDSSYLGVSLEGNRHVENQIEAGLLQKGFQVVDAGQVERKRQLEALFLKGDPSSAGRIAKDFGAEILVEVEVRRSFVEQRKVFGRSMRFFSNEVRLKALETDTAKILYSGYRTRPASGAGALMPLEEGTAELIDEMVDGILGQWRKDVFQAGSYHLDLSGVSFDDLSRVKKALGDMRGVGEVRVRDFQSGRALLEVQYKGALEELAKKIGGLKSPALEVTALRANTLEMRVKK